MNKRKSILNYKLHKYYKDWTDFDRILRYNTDSFVDYLYFVSNHFTNDEIINDKIVDIKKRLFNKEYVVFMYIGYRYTYELKKLFYSNKKLYHDVKALCAITQFQKKIIVKEKNKVIYLNKKNIKRNQKILKLIKEEKVEILTRFYKEKIINKKNLFHLCKIMKLNNSSKLILFVKKLRNKKNIKKNCLIQKYFSKLVS